MIKIVLLLAFFLSPHAFSKSWHQLKFSLEGGFGAIASHSYQSSKAGSLYDFVKEGNQNVLFASWRSSLGLQIFNKHLVELTYQPIYLDTQSIASRDLKFDDITIPKGDSYNARYYFPFYRLAYFYSLIAQKKWNWSLGGGLQMRSVSISFSSLDGKKRFAQNNIGPVPLITTRLQYNFDNDLFLGADLAGFWSPIPIANGGTEKTTGWIYDLAIKTGLVAADWIDLYLSTRLIGGGAKGDGSPRPSGERYTYNNLNILNFTAGATLKF